MELEIVAGKNTEITGVTHILSMALISVLERWHNFLTFINMCKVSRIGVGLTWIFT